MTHLDSVDVEEDEEEEGRSPDDEGEDGGREEGGGQLKKEKEDAWRHETQHAHQPSPDTVHQEQTDEHSYTQHTACYYYATHIWYNLTQHAHQPSSDAIHQEQTDEHSYTQHTINDIIHTYQMLNSTLINE